MPPDSQGGNELTTRRNVVCALLLSAALLINATPAVAVPSSKLDQARAVKSQVDALDARVERASERYNEAADKHAKLLVQKRAAEKKLKKVRARMDVVQKHLNVRARSMYRSGPMGFVDVLLGAQSFDEFAATWDVLRDLNESDAASVAELKSLRAEAKAAHKTLAAKEKAASHQVAIMRTNRNAILDKLAERKRKLAGLESEIAALERAEEAAQAARAVSFVKHRSRGDRNFPPPRHAARSEVVAIAKQYLGAPYVWGADGPNSFDCSGLTMFVYRQVGVSLPHSSRAQINCGERVSRSDLQPGDLVFFGSPIHHVGIYVGGGMYIHAPHTGDVVKISPLNRNDYAGACRP